MMGKKYKKLNVEKAGIKFDKILGSGALTEREAQRLANATKNTKISGPMTDADLQRLIKKLQK